MAKARDKIASLLATIDELQSSDSQSQLAAKRAERELRDERDKALRLERELEGWKVMRLERGVGPAALHRSGTMAALSEMAESQGRGAAHSASRAGSRRVSGVSSVGVGVALAEGVQRKPSNTKGFL